MKLLVLLSLLMVGCTVRVEHKGEWRMVRCSKFYGCETEYAFSTEKACREMITPLNSPTATINYTCEEIK